MPTGVYARPTLEERFWQKVDKSGDCWVWTASGTQGGYGQFWDGRRIALAHRFAYELLVGPIPDGLQIDHLCRNRRCVNPKHLDPVSCRENLVRSENQIAQQVAQTHCIHGHALTGANLYVRPTGKRECRSCARDRETRRVRPGRGGVPRADAA